MHSCPMCQCTERRRFTISDELLQSVMDHYRIGGLELVKSAFNRSHSQAYRLIALGKQREVSRRVPS
jgi:hypothetical protein